MASRIYDSREALRPLQIASPTSSCTLNFCKFVKPWQLGKQAQSSSAAILVIATCRPLQMEFCSMDSLDGGVAVLLNDLSERTLKLGVMRSFSTLNSVGSRCTARSISKPRSPCPCRLRSTAPSPLAEPAAVTMSGFVMTHHGK